MLQLPDGLGKFLLIVMQVAVSQQMKIVSSCENLGKFYQLFQFLVVQNTDKNPDRAFICNSK